MNSASQNKNGFTTFLATLVISLTVFGVLYYLITDFSGKINIEEPTPVQGTGVAAVTDTSVFGKLSEQKMDVPAKEVLAGADEMGEETTESTVPDTGSHGMTIAAVFAATTLTIGGYFVIAGPRKLALAGFEEDILKETD